MEVDSFIEHVLDSPSSASSPNSFRPSSAQVRKCAAVWAKTKQGRWQAQGWERGRHTERAGDPARPRPAAACACGSASAMPLHAQHSRARIMKKAAEAAASQKRMSMRAWPSGETYGLSPPRGPAPSSVDRLRQGARRGAAMRGSGLLLPAAAAGVRPCTGALPRCGGMPCSAPCLALRPRPRCRSLPPAAHCRSNPCRRAASPPQLGVPEKNVVKLLPALLPPLLLRQAGSGVTICCCTGRSDALRCKPGGRSLAAQDATAQPH